MKYKIVKTYSNNNNHYIVKKKILFVWTTLTYFDCCIDGMMAENYRYEFDTVDEAERFIGCHDIKEENICIIEI